MMVYCLSEDAGSAQTIHGYARAAKALGHEMVLYGFPRIGTSLEYSLDVKSADAVILVLEWWYLLHPGGYLNLVRLLAAAPRERRVLLDVDGMYNDVVRVNGDYNHADRQASQYRVELCDALSDKICQPTLHPLHANVRSFLFHAYDPSWEMPLDFDSQEFGMLYVGNNWFRWPALHRVLKAVEPIRDEVGCIGLVGYGWDGRADWIEPPLRDHAYRTEPDYLRDLGVELMPAVGVDQVIATMSRGRCNPVLVRPLFHRLQVLTPRLFETPAAATIPLLALDEGCAREIYGPAVAELVPGDDPSTQILDIIRHPECYAPIVREIRGHLAEHHSYAARLRELVEIVESPPCA